MVFQQATLTLYEGTTYTFNVNASGHPFRFSTTNGHPTVVSDYTTGVTESKYIYCYICRTRECTINFILLLCCTQRYGWSDKREKSSVPGIYRCTDNRPCRSYVIGGQTIERITGDYIYMYDQIHSNKDDIDQTLYFLTGHGNYIDVAYDWDYSIFLTLLFL